MSTTDESENLETHLSGRARARGWRVISDPTRQPDTEAGELKTLIQTMQKGRRRPGRPKVDEKDPPEAA